MRKYVLWTLLILCFSLAGCNAGPSTAAGAKTLTLAVFASESSLSRSGLSGWIHSYNENNSDVKIEIVNYQENYQDPWEALSQLKIEIVAGKGPDMVNFSLDWDYSPLDASSGMLADLYPFMLNDESFDKQDFHYNILESFAVGGSLYVLVPSFWISSFATVGGGLSGLERMDIKQLVDAYNMLDDEGILFPGETKKDVLAMICYRGLENYVDWAGGTCFFDSDSFKEILHFANQFPLTLNIPDDFSAKTFFTEGRALLYPVSIDSVYGTARIRMLYGETPTYIGYPFDSGNGNLANIEDIAIGISSNSKNKEDAWGFIKSLLDSEFQDDIGRVLPVRASSLEKKLAEAVETEYDANNEKIVKERLIWDGEDPVNIYEISKEDAETLESIIGKIEFNATVDYTLYSIMLEEADYLFNDNRNVDAVADIIQNRASIYISENK